MWKFIFWGFYIGLRETYPKSVEKLYVHGLHVLAEVDAVNCALG